MEKMDHLETEETVATKVIPEIQDREGKMESRVSEDHRVILGLEDRLAAGVSVDKKVIDAKQVHRLLQFQHC